MRVRRKNCRVLSAYLPKSSDSLPRSQSFYCNSEVQLGRQIFRNQYHNYYYNAFRPGINRNIFTAIRGKYLFYLCAQTSFGFLSVEGTKKSTIFQFRTKMNYNENDSNFQHYIFLYNFIYSIYLDNLCFQLIMFQIQIFG